MNWQGCTVTRCKYLTNVYWEAGPIYMLCVTKCSVTLVQTDIKLVIQRDIKLGYVSNIIFKLSEQMFCLHNTVVTNNNNKSLLPFVWHQWDKNLSQMQQDVLFTLVNILIQFNGIIV